MIDEKDGILLLHDEVPPSMRGFRTSLEQALRSQEWVRHTVDYWRFKKRLKYFARRRCQILRLLRASHDQTLSEQTLIDLLGSAPHPSAVTPFHHHPSAEEGSSTTPTAAANPEDVYMNAPLSYNLSMDAHAHIGRSSASSADVYVEMKEYPSSHNRSDDSTVDSSSSSAKPPKQRSQRSIMRRISISERNEIFAFLEWEMDKSLMFYLSQWQKLSLRLEQLQQSPPIAVTDPLAQQTPPEESTRRRILAELSEDILELMVFVLIQIITTQQILIRYDAFALAFEGTPMFQYYMKQVLSGPPSSFRKIQQHEELEALAESYQHLCGPSDPSFTAQWERWRLLLERLPSSEGDRPVPRTTASTTNRHRCCDSCLVFTMQKWLHLALLEDRLGLEPAHFWTSRGQSLVQEMALLAAWRQRKFAAEEDMASEEEEEDPNQSTERKLSGLQVFHLTLNLLAAFLYCMNYYIVEPSSTMYVNRLGAHDAMSGTLIGMMPLAAFLSSIPYSMWTNRSFRHPFIMSCCMLILGNLLYSLADQFGHVSIALWGRFLAGLGAPKCIIRRYMADTTPVSLRTSVNAGFGMVVAAGSAMGPAMAILLNRIEYTFYVKHIGIVTLNGLTLPGYFMACLWLTFGIILVLTFEEPDREGLKEQKALEARGPTSEHDDLRSVFSGESSGPLPVDGATNADNNLVPTTVETSTFPWPRMVRRTLDWIPLPVRICLGLLFAKVFTIESLVSSTSALTKNRYQWQVRQVGQLGFANGVLVIPFSILIGRLSLTHQDHVLMKWLVSLGCFGMFLLIDLSDLVSTPTGMRYNAGHILAVSPRRYMAGYFLTYLSIQAFEGVIGSTLSKVIPTSLASGTFNSGLLATLVDTFGRACGDLFISAAGFVSLRQLMNLLFIPGFSILLTCLVVIERCRDLLSV